MVIKGNYIKLIFGLKVKQLRIEKKMLLSELASKTGMSISYLNEIETGKKYPKADKIAALAGSLNTTYDKLVSLRLARNLAPIGELLESNILEQLPLDHYGIDINKLIFLMSNSSMQLSALISTFIEMAQTSELSQNNFSKTAIRTFKEFNENYFEDLENSVRKFYSKYKLKESPRINYQQLKTILEKSFNYEINESSINKYPELDELRGVVIKKKRNQLLLNGKLSDAQKAFVVGKELAYNYLNIKDRSYIYSSLKLNTFDHLLNNFKASYFSTALIINGGLLLKDLEQFFKLKKWEPDRFLTLLNKYNATTEMFFQRITNLSSKFFGLNKFFFLRFNHEIGSSEYRLSNELRLNTRLNPVAGQINEHFCRRWVPFETLKNLESLMTKEKDFGRRIINICRSRYYESDDEYICISAGQKGNLLTNVISSIAIGFQVDDSLSQKIKFVYDPEIPVTVVNDTCERCKIQGCKERVALPTSAEKMEKYLRLEKILKTLFEEENI